ncbi:aminodeoxychorismate/anthranilate synthase component II [Streptomyces xiaopingdaonensis]|uniref:aminodeoxychorismate/anthranilate synthase component II n=1 Tax=Streptomyces xiaopingdaonensis TaxID=1565415 RepID=UPI0002DCD894|nr:aminodeoxychorismate/anthranilate synthase component II [Streptomyces xiaopingdaonensis]
MTRILVVDNYDSFVFNLVQYLQQLGAECEVVRNDEVAPAHADEGFAGVLLSPGPGAPAQAGVCREMVGHCAAAGVPLFGVCLGMQTIAEWYGGEVTRAPELLHGKTSPVHHKGAGVFRGLPSPFTATRYHSLGVPAESLPPELLLTAETAEGLVMGVRHRELAVEGVQFHPESVLTEWGHRMLANWLEECGDRRAVARSAGLAGVSGTVGAGAVLT